MWNLMSVPQPPSIFLKWCITDSIRNIPGILQGQCRFGKLPCQRIFHYAQETCFLYLLCF